MRLLPLAAIALLLGCRTGGQPQASPADLRIIAHRGGVVGEEFAENSPAAIEAAVERGYWMVEIDIRESKDGRLVMQHDEDFQRFYGEDRQLAEMTWDEIAALRATPGGSRPQLFDEIAALCKGRLRVMLDTKPPEHPEEFQIDSPYDVWLRP